MCSWPFGSGGNRVTTGLRWLPEARSSATISRMKSRGGASRRLSGRLSALGVGMKVLILVQNDGDVPRAADPMTLFRKWYREAAAAGTVLPEAMALATAT